MRPAYWPWMLGFAMLVGLDQWTKAWVRASFVLGESIPVLGELLRLTYVQNPGVAFGLEPFPPLVLMLFGATAAVGLAIYLYKLVRDRDRLMWPVFLFWCGAVGNSIDRVLFRSVTDFFDADFPDFIMQRWPVFNIADSCVTVGIVLLLWQTLFMKQHAPLSTTSGERLDSSSLSTSSSSGTETAAAGPLSHPSPSSDLPQ